MDREETIKKTLEHRIYKIIGRMIEASPEEKEPLRDQADRLLREYKERFGADYDPSKAFHYIHNQIEGTRHG